MFDESLPPDATLQPEKQKPKVSLSQDPKQAKVYTYYNDYLHTPIHCHMFNCVCELEGGVVVRRCVCVCVCVCVCLCVCVSVCVCVLSMF